MRRKDFLKSASILSIGSALFPSIGEANSQKKTAPKNGKYKNVIFMVSDGMSKGTLTMANHLHQHIHNKDSEWINAYINGEASAHGMDTSAANALVTDSAAGSSAWGGGRKVHNGALNYNVEEKTFNTPILKKMKEAGKSIGCVTTVAVTHATPAGFCVATTSRNDQDAIAEMYLQLEPDVLLGGGAKFFEASARKDKQDLAAEFLKKNYKICKNKQDLSKINAQNTHKLLGYFAQDELPYQLDTLHNLALNAAIPTLAEMTKTALEILAKNNNGFMLQIEAGKVDWAAHANDIGALLFDQLAFDKTIAVVKSFVTQHPDTLVIITTDHGNANPGLFYGKNSNDNFKKIMDFKQTTTSLLHSISNKNSANDIIQKFKYAFGLDIGIEEASNILSYYDSLSTDKEYDYKKLPFKYAAELLSKHTSVKFADTDHSSDYAELAVIGKYLYDLPTFVQNTDLHHFILKQTGI